MERKELKVTQRLIIIGATENADKSKCCKAEIRQSRVYPRPLYCTGCQQEIKFEDQVQWKNAKPSYEPA